MVFIRYSGPRPRDINLPETVNHRSAGGSVLLIPGANVEITDQEWAFIRDSHPDVLPHIGIYGRHGLAPALKPA